MTNTEPRKQRPTPLSKALRVPTAKQLEAMLDEGIALAACEYGCMVEPDGTCPHGNRSWLIELSLI